MDLAPFQDSGRYSEVFIAAGAGAEERISHRCALDIFDIMHHAAQFEDIFVCHTKLLQLVTIPAVIFPVGGGRTNPGIRAAMFRREDYLARVEQRPILTLPLPEAFRHIGAS